MQKRLLSSQWCFFKAGQGCFYSGQVKTRGNKPFTFVYDCGSQGTAILKKEIRNFKNFLADEPHGCIDLLVLSHLDADHINQVDYLLTGLDCKRVVLPYLNPLERLFLYFNAGFDDSTDDDEFIEFIIDPAGFLIERGVKEVIFITGNDENGFLNTNLPGPDSPKHQLSSDEETADRDLFEADVQFRDDENALAEEQRLLMNAYVGKLKFSKANNAIRAGRFWEFFFYQIEQPNAALWDFREQLMLRFGVTLDVGYLSVDDLKRIFSEQAKVDELKKVFKAIFKDTNSTGLMVMHGPISHYHARFSTGTAYTSEPFCFTLLCGDTDMHNRYPDYIHTRLPYVRVFQVPHHGSDKNWDFSKLDMLEDCQMVINYGTKNGYGHPGPTVVRDILSLSHVWWKRANTELNAFCYQVYAYHAAAIRRRSLAPLGRTHEPVISTTEYRTVDDQENLGRRTDARALSLGRSQWDHDEFSVKAWRSVRGRWSRQSEEVPLHRALDLAIMVISGMIEEKTGQLPGHHLQLEIQQANEMADLRDYIKARSGLLEERAREILILTEAYLQLLR